MADDISHVLDWAGFSRDEIQHRRKSWKRLQFIQRILKPSIDNVPVPHLTGSRVEGHGTVSMGSDQDLMLCDINYRVIIKTSDWKELPNGKHTLLLDNDGVYPGYTRLKLLYDNRPEIIKSTQWAEYIIPYWTSKNSYETNEIGDIYLSSIISDKKFRGLLHQQGPAVKQTLGRSDAINDLDQVFCFKVDGYPEISSGWSSRERPSGWPSQQLIAEVMDIGHYIVPVGYKGSSNPNIEWRISSALMELRIIHNWSNQVSKCYILLKLLKNYVTECHREVGDILTSYHLKTLLFWLTEETGMEWWDQHTLVECLMFSLTRLSDWLNCGHIPHYFVSGSNLFELQKGSPNRSILCYALRQLLSNGPVEALHKTPYKEWLLSSRKRTQFRISPYVARSRVDLHTHFVVKIMENVAIVVEKKYTECEPSFPKFASNMHEFKEKLQEARASSSGKTDILDSLIKYCDNSCGSHILSHVLYSRSTMARQNEDNIEIAALCKRSLNLLTSSESFDSMSAKLKLANYYFQFHQYGLTLARIDRILDTYDKKKHIPIALDGISYQVSQINEIASIKSTLEAMQTHFALAVVFTKGELHAVPGDLKYELFKHCGPITTNIEIQSAKDKNRAIVDSVVFGHYLKFLCFHRLNQIDRCHDVLDDLVDLSYNYDRLVHPETALNIVGHCFLKLGDLPMAATCYINSLSVEPNPSASLWPLAAVVSRIITSMG